MLEATGGIGADLVVEVVSALWSLGVVQPLIVVSAALLLAWSIPGYQGVLGGVGFLVGFGLLLIFDDFTVYWWHRLAHSAFRLPRLRIAKLLAAPASSSVSWLLQP